MALSGEEDKLLAQKLMYNLPSSDQGMVKQRKTVTFKALRNIYYEGDNILIDLQSATGCIDPEHSFVRGTLKLQSASVTTLKAKQTQFKQFLVALPIGAQGLISSLRVRSMGDQELEYVRNYDKVAAVVDRTTKSDHWIETKGQDEGWCALALRDKRPGIKTAHAPDGWGTTLYVGGGKDPGMTLACAQTYELLAHGMDVKIPLRHSGIFGPSRKFIPLFLMGKVRLELETASNGRGLQIIPINNTAWRGGAAPTSAEAQGMTAKSEALTGEGAGVGPHYISGTAADFNSSTTSAKWELHDVEFVCDIVELSAAMKKALASAASSSGLPLHFETVSTTSTNIPKDSKTQINQVITKGAANATRCVTVQFSNQDSKLEALYPMAYNKYETYQGGLESYQYRLGTMGLPDFECKSLTIMKSEYLKALPRDEEGRRPSINRWAYSWGHMTTSGTEDNRSVCSYDHIIEDTTPDLRRHLLIRCNPSVIYNDHFYAYWGLDAVKGVTKLSNYDTGLTRTGFEPTKFGVGISLQSTPGIALSGKSTNAGQQLRFVGTLADTWTAPAAETELGTKQNYFVHRLNSSRTCMSILWYTRIVLIGANQQVVVKE